jgi:hypothetical protein
LHQSGDAGHPFVAEPVVEPLDQLDQQIAAASFMGADQFLEFREGGDHLGPHHLAEQRFLGIEVEVNGAFAHPGQAGDIVQLGAGEARLTEDGLRRVEDLLWSGVGPALPARSGNVWVRAISQREDPRGK